MPDAEGVDIHAPVPAVIGRAFEVFQQLARLVDADDEEIGSPLLRVILAAAAHGAVRSGHDVDELGRDALDLDRQAIALAGPDDASDIKAEAPEHAGIRAQTR